MEFFFPNANSERKMEKIYQTLRLNIERGLRAELSTRRIHSLNYHHNGREEWAVVGENEKISGEMVLAIFYEPNRQVYHVCTPYRGLLEGMPILVGQDEIRGVVDFD